MPGTSRWPAACTAVGFCSSTRPSAYFRAFHGVPVTVTAPDGTPINAVRGTLDVLARQIRDLHPQAFVACFDADWRPAWRVEAIPSYKTHRVAEDGGDGTPDPLEAQVPILEAVLDAIGLARCGVADFEADDVIGTYAGNGRARSTWSPATATSSSWCATTVRYASSTASRSTRRSTRQPWSVNTGFPERSYGEFAVLRGDPSDGLPGVPGIGAKTAAALSTASARSRPWSRHWNRGQDTGFPAGARAKLERSRDYLAAAGSSYGFALTSRSRAFAWPCPANRPTPRSRPPVRALAPRFAR